MFSYNHIGYLPGNPKVFYIDKPQDDHFHILHIDESVKWKVVFRGKLEKCGQAYVGDFSDITAPGDYRICCGDESSNCFVIKDDVYAHLERMITIFYTWQRCGSKKGWAGLCHQELDNLYGTDKKLDMRGGYHQSGDLRCWNDGCSSALYGYMRYAEVSDPIWNDGIFDEELRWGVDYFRKTVSPEGFIYDCQFVPLGWGSRDYYNVPSSLSAHYNVCRLLARSSVYFREKDPDYAAQNLALAEKIWNFTEKSDAFDIPYTPHVEDLPPGTQGARFYWQNRKGCTGMDCAAAAAAYDLFFATGKEEYLERTRSDMDKVISRQILEGDAEGLFLDRTDNDRLAFQDCSYGHNHSGMVFLADLLQSEKKFSGKQEWLDALQRHCDMIVREFEFHTITGNLPVPVGKNFMGELPDVPAFKTSPIPIVHQQCAAPAKGASYAFILIAGYELFGKKEYLLYAQHAVDYILGANHGGASYITGVGYGHVKLPAYGQFFPSTPQIPGGIAHLYGGEYDLPIAGLLLRVLLKFKK